MPEQETQTQVLKGWFYVPPIHCVYELLELPSPGTLIKNFCEEKGIPAPLASNTINKVCAFPPRGKNGSTSKMGEWHSAVSPEQRNQALSSLHFKGGGFLGGGAATWVTQLPYLSEEFEQEFPYVFEVINRLINEEKLVLTAIINADVHPQEIQKKLFNNSKVAFILEGVRLQGSGTEAHTSSITECYPNSLVLIANTLLYFLAAWDVEYSIKINPEKSHLGFLRQIVPRTYKKGYFHRAFWERLKHLAVNLLGGKDTWEALEQGLRGVEEPADARRTLNRYKTGKVKISPKSLDTLITKVFGSYSDYLWGPYLAKYWAVMFLSNLFEEADKYLEKTEVDSLLLRYHEYYDQHYRALAGNHKGSN